MLQQSFYNRTGTGFPLMYEDELAIAFMRLALANNPLH
ncbi:hypothetical protein HCH_01835 [Hahella chejuensis KCTC 2396]|uniref:Uncharacterized protein n=1 Tax=Hahella chejuensis (strain KCTC 2396) TaxID=349521 RepID=Q2SL00_HAHCH|nr:hypothetical protein HCH_01835 [Hahella chejuensis KCTC 2396]